MTDDNPMGLPWKVPSRQKQGELTEKRLLKERGARRHPRSGAGHIKEDGSDDDYLYEIKDANKSYTLKAKELKTSFIRAVRQGRQPIWLVYFSDQDFTAEIRVVAGGKELVESGKDET